MAKSNGSNKKKTQSRPPATTPEARENELVALALNQAEKSLREGTASQQVVLHFVKTASTKEKLEREKLALEKELVEAKTENLKSSKRIEELYSEAMVAMRSYQGNMGGNNEED